MSVFVRQQGPQQTIANGFGGFGGASCTTTGPQTWTTTANAESRKFNPGTTFVQVSGQVCSPPDFIDCRSSQAELTLKVNRDRG